MSSEAQDVRSVSSSSSLQLNEDWWSVIIGLGLVAAALVAFELGSTIKWIAVVPPAKWADFNQLKSALITDAPRYGALFLLWTLLLGLPIKALGFPFRHFLPAFVLVFILSVAIYSAGQWVQAGRYNLEPPLVALVLGLILGNLGILPRWLDAGFRVEYYVKIGIVLLGSMLPFTLLLWAGPTALLQASIVSLVTFGVIYFVGAKLLGLDRRLAATLGAGGAICGVSASIAIAGAVGAKKEDAPVAITLVIFWAIIAIFVLPWAAQQLHLSAGVAGAWIGTSEFADAAGQAAATTYDGYVGASSHTATTVFTLVKVVGRDVWIGIWAFVLSIIATTVWEKTGVEKKADAGEIWRRFPKFVIGFLVASAIVTIVSAHIDLAAYNKDGTGLKAVLVTPLQNLRTWAFTFTFLAIGLTTRLRDLSGVGKKPFLAFTAGVVVNVALGYLLSAVVFAKAWQDFH